MTMTAKTPVSILNEYMFRLGITPHYELIQNSAGHDTIFQYVVSAGVVRETGVGRSKKEAKHTAAQRALKKLAESDSNVRAQLLMTSGAMSERDVRALEGDDTAPVAVSPYAEQMTENAVGALADLCAQNNLTPPFYDLTGESGPPHAKTFDIRCTVLSQQEHGISRTKKQAKQIAAKRMYEKIKEYLSKTSPVLRTCLSPSHVEQPQSNEKSKAVIEEYCAIKDKDHGNAVTPNVGQSLSGTHLSLRKLYGHMLSTLRAYAADHSAKETLTMFADGNAIQLTYTFIGSGEKGDFLCAASLSTMPDLVQFGKGCDSVIAEDMASINLLKALITMIVYDNN